VANIRYRPFYKAIGLSMSSTKLLILQEDTY